MIIILMVIPLIVIIMIAIIMMITMAILIINDVRIAIIVIYIFVRVNNYLVSCKTKQLKFSLSVSNNMLMVL